MPIWSGERVSVVFVVWGDEGLVYVCSDGRLTAILPSGDRSPSWPSITQRRGFVFICVAMCWVPGGLAVFKLPVVM